jgi:hypothetical protein
MRLRIADYGLRIPSRDIHVARSSSRAGRSPHKGRWNIAQGERSEPWDGRQTRIKPPKGATEPIRCSRRDSVTPVGGYAVRHDPHPGLAALALGFTPPSPSGTVLPARLSIWSLVSLAVLFVCLFLAGCGKGAPAANANANGAEEVKPIVKTAEVGPVKMTVTADKNRITIAERLKLTIEITAASGVDIEMGEPGDQLNEFQVRNFTNRPAEAVEGGRRWARTYDLDIFLSGEYSVPAIEARFIDHRKEDASQRGGPTSQPVEGIIRTEPFTVTVTSLLEGTFDPAKFRDIKGPVELPVERKLAWLRWVAAGAAVVAGGVGLALWWRRRKRRRQEQLVVVPHEWAFDQLRLLIDDKLVEQGLVHEFYFRLSHIVRVYIELRFGLMAPERTTEEFLVEVHRSDALRADHKTLLGDFLQACDMVKFAMYEPTAAEVERAFDSARDFVEQTVPRGMATDVQITEAAA